MPGVVGVYNTLGFLARSAEGIEAAAEEVLGGGGGGQDDGRLQVGGWVGAGFGMTF